MSAAGTPDADKRLGADQLALCRVRLRIGNDLVDEKSNHEVIFCYKKKWKTYITTLVSHFFFVFEAW